MSEISIINTITVPLGMESKAEAVREEYVAYFQQQDGFVRSTFYKSLNREADGSLKYINTVVWKSYSHYEQVVNLGFSNADGENKEGMRVLGRGFPEPIQVSPGQYEIINDTDS